MKYNLKDTMKFIVMCGDTTREVTLKDVVTESSLTKVIKEVIEESKDVTQTLNKELMGK